MIQNMSKKGRQLLMAYDSNATYYKQPIIDCVYFCARHILTVSGIDF